MRITWQERVLSRVATVSEYEPAVFMERELSLFFERRGIMSFLLAIQKHKVRSWKLKSV